LNDKVLFKIIALSNAWALIVVILYVLYKLIPAWFKNVYDPIEEIFLISISSIFTNISFSLDKFFNILNPVKNFKSFNEVTSFQLSDNITLSNKSLLLIVDNSLYVILLLYVSYTLLACNKSKHIDLNTISLNGTNSWISV
jgi:hypothetical protein